MDDDEEQGDAAQLDVGSRGEHFIFKLLTTQFDAPADCWTSNMRTEHDLPAFADNETMYTDFTVYNRKVCNDIIAWLLSCGHDEAMPYIGRPVTYRIEVKTTSGGRDEPFSLSRNQYNQAVQCAKTGRDVYVILRVYDVLGTEKIHAYVNPYAQQEDGKLSIEPTKYCVQALC
ncbi:hypothetical protein LTR22_025652 [Elasticomyces elasticus]|nr:hypothetical protein LTR22_025652 [Elasticomyces elasticus]